ncbi:MAG TPA: UvrD-helicase domain-containing protein [Alphaproteobacteria bacterium]|nr:MAG: UvrD-helicase domain-containing protein [Rhodospirillales bacterium]HOO81934.1 UvrD-helicase domain-containing protein [Alphaproteobacteria bacterium]
MQADSISAMAVPQPPYLEGLNDPQREAIETLDGPVLVLAGAGTGKTRVLTTRLAHLLNTGRVYPSQILAVTFTNKAAQEMKERVSGLMGGQPVEGWWLGTFHSLAARMLRRHADMVGLSSNFTILDPDDQVRLLKQIMEVNGVDHKKWAPKAMISFIDRWKDRGLNPPQVSGDDVGDIAGGKLPLLYEIYQRRLREINACDFGDLLLHMITILKDPANKHVLDEYHNRFRYIMVDEYQDTNVAQYLWLRLLAQGHNNICCVGDDDQSIYGWRGAEVGNILKFEKDFPGAQIIRLEQNYRSTNNILKAAHAVIANNDGRLGKELWSEAGEGDKIQVRGLWDGEAEARWAGEEIEQLQRKGQSLNGIAVLVRAGFQTREFEERFIKLGLPYKVLGGPRFYERMEIRDALAYLRVIVQPADDLALERIINKPKRGLGDTTVQTLYAYGRSHGINLYDSIMDLTQTDELRPKVKTTLMKLLDDFGRWRSLVETMDHAELAAQVLDESGYMQMWKEDKTPEAPGRVENLKELISGMQEYEALPEFLEHVALVLENQDASGGEFATIMTLHGAKGLEFDCVFLPGWEEGLFPSQRSMDENGLKGLEEERRLAYVGITRAKRRAYISFAANRRMYGSWVNAIPSRFIDELPKEQTEVQSDLGLAGSGRSSHWDSSGFAPKVQKRQVASQTHDRKVMSESGTVFQRGDRVFHDKFGYGKIVNIDGHKLDIAFEKSGKKRVMDSFIEKPD